MERVGFVAIVRLLKTRKAASLTCSLAWHCFCAMGGRVCVPCQPAGVLFSGKRRSVIDGRGSAAAVRAESNIDVGRGPAGGMVGSRSAQCVDRGAGGSVEGEMAETDGGDGNKERLKKIVNTCKQKQAKLK